MEFNFKKYYDYIYELKNNSDNFEFKYDFSKFKKHVQAFAIFIPDEKIDDGRGMLWFKKQYEFFNEFINECSDVVVADFNNIKKNKVNLFLTLENAGIIEKLEDVLDLKKMGIKFVTLTWNGENNIGYSHLYKNGLKPFGKNVIKELENNNIIIDVSHLNLQGFTDVCEYSNKPFIASHSNVKEICNNSRNLSKEQIKIIIEKKGLIGLNFHKMFLTNDYNNENINYLDCIIKHIEYILSFGGKQVLSLGTDFDGAKPPQILKNTLYIENLINKMLK
ncbi:MAG: membrane dipeptidase, partial [Oscillospiraceae bacterium]